MNSNPLDLFYRYAQVVCAVNELSTGLSKVYFGVFNNDPNLQPDFQRVLEAFEKILQSGRPDLEKEIKGQILSDAGMAATTLLIIKLWYLGIIPSIGNPVNPLSRDGFYFHHEALIWKIAHAHPAGLSGGYYGYWAYKPEN
jgi:hypothetical protein